MKESAALTGNDDLAQAAVERFIHKGTVTHIIHVSLQENRDLTRILASMWGVVMIKSTSGWLSPGLTLLDDLFADRSKPEKCKQPLEMAIDVDITKMKPR